MRSFPFRRRAAPALVSLVAALVATALPLAAASDGVYNGTVGGKPFSLTVTGNKITAWSAEDLACPAFTIVEVSISGVNCNITAGNTFTCGNLGCQLGVPKMRIGGSFSGNTVTGIFDIDLDPDIANPCCSLRNFSFSATRSAATPPAAPTGLTATALDSDRIRLEWNDNSNNETEFRMDLRVRGQAFRELSPALPANSEAAIVSGLDPATDYTFRLRARNATGFSPYSNEATATTFDFPSVCVPSDTTLCLNNNRYKVEATWQTAGNSGVAHGVQLTPDTGYLWFFSASNVEAVVKVINACVVPFNRYWVFAGGLTDQRVDIVVTDTQTGAIKKYTNPLGTKFAPVQDTDAFATCP